MFNSVTTQLENGLKVIQIPMRAMGSVSVIALINAGSRYERPNEEGVSHLIEHLVFQGTEKYPTHLDLAQRLDQVGADTNAFTAKEYTGYYVTTISEHFEVSLDVINQLLFHPRLSEEDLAKEKEVIYQEIDLRCDDPAQHINNVFERLVYSNTGLAHDISGSKQTLKQISVQQVKNFMEQWYEKPNMVLVITGDEQLVGSEQTLEAIKEIFTTGAKADNSSQKKQTDKRERINSFLTDSPISKQQLSIELRQTAQEHFILGWPGLERKHPDRYALSLLSTIIGGNRSSRLFVDIRERKGLAYYIWSDVDQYHDGGVVGAQGALNPKFTLEGIEATVDQFIKMGSGERPVTESELKAAKDYVLGRMMLGLESSQSVARYYALKDILLDLIEDPEEVVEQVKSITIDQVNNLAARLFIPGKLRLAVVGPYSEKEKLQALIE